MHTQHKASSSSPLNAAIPTIHITGDSCTAVVFSPPGCIKFDRDSREIAYLHAIPVGLEYLYGAIRVSWNPDCGKHQEQLANLKLSCRAGNSYFFRHLLVAYEVVNLGQIRDLNANCNVPRLQFASTTPKPMKLSALSVSNHSIQSGRSPAKPHILVHWFGQLSEKSTPRVRPKKRVTCKFHIQIGLSQQMHPSGFPTEKGPIRPDELAIPNCARLLVINIGELTAEYRIRSSLSYEAIAVDLLRVLRGDGSKPVPSKQMDQLSLHGKYAANLSVLIVRLSNCAVFMYVCGMNRPSSKNGLNKESSRPARFKEIGCWLLYHKSECGPLSHPQLGRMVDNGDFVSAQLATGIASYLLQKHKDPISEIEIRQEVQRSVRRSIVWQRAGFERGILKMLYSGTDTSAQVDLPNSERPQLAYDSYFSEIVTAVKKDLPDKDYENPTTFDAQFEDKVRCLEVDIERAVAHRTQWFMAWSAAKAWPHSKKSDPNRNEIDVEATFRKIVINWLHPVYQEAEVPLIPVVQIGDAALTDRREVEDYLALDQALRVYADSRSEKSPLNIAVFGAPGAGKSFAVKQLIKHLGHPCEHLFREEPLTFNLAQFNNPDDLPDALQLVRNACLSSEIPIVFFDEFDASFNGQPFWWLKFFLAPMQDGEFYHHGQNYKIGRAVFVFAGGVNRSFEEFNGRARNTGFWDAKGPDFISRLRAHLNIQGINKPEDDADQGRYLLRRGILLRTILQRKLGVAKDETRALLLHPSVASALLQVKRFKHGVRSLEAIIKMCTSRPGKPIGPSDLPSMDQLEMHVDGAKLVEAVDSYWQEPDSNHFGSILPPI